MFYKRLAITFLYLFTTGHLHAQQVKGGCPNFPNLTPQTGPLMYLNCDFHNAYVARIKMLKNTFGAPNGRPVILDLGGKLVLKYNGQTQIINITPDPYSQLKAFAHGIFSVFLILSTQKPGEIYKTSQEDLKVIVRNMEESQQSLTTLAPDVIHDINSLVQETKSFVFKSLADNGWREDELKKYYARINGYLKKIIKYSANIELTALDKAVNLWLAGISKEEHANIAILVATAHQARAKSITIQYFAKKFHKVMCEGALCEDGLVVMEDKFDENSALELLARHYLDKQAGEVIFNNPKRLQFDVLA